MWLEQTAGGALSGDHVNGRGVEGIKAGGVTDVGDRPAGGHLRDQGRHVVDVGLRQFAVVGGDQAGHLVLEPGVDGGVKAAIPLLPAQALGQVVGPAGQGAGAVGKLFQLSQVSLRLA